LIDQWGMMFWNKNNINSLLTIHFSSKNKNIQMDDKIQAAKMDLKALY